MIWGYEFRQIVDHLAGLGYREARRIEGNVLFLHGAALFTIREPNELGLLPETLVLDAFDNAGLPPPAPASNFVD